MWTIIYKKNNETIKKTIDGTFRDVANFIDNNSNIEIISTRKVGSKLDSRDVDDIMETLKVKMGDF